MPPFPAALGGGNGAGGAAARGGNSGPLPPPPGTCSSALGGSASQGSNGASAAAAAAALGELGGSEGVTDAHLEALGASLGGGSMGREGCGGRRSGLVELHLNGVAAVTGAGLSHLRALGALRALSLCGALSARGVSGAHVQVRAAWQSCYRLPQCAAAFACGVGASAVTCCAARSQALLAALPSLRCLALGRALPLFDAADDHNPLAPLAPAAVAAAALPFPSAPADAAAAPGGPAAAGGGVSGVVRAGPWVAERLAADLGRLQYLGLQFVHFLEEPVSLISGCGLRVWLHGSEAHFAPVIALQPCSAFIVAEGAVGGAAAGAAGGAGRGGHRPLLRPGGWVRAVGLGWPSAAGAGRASASRTPRWVIGRALPQRRGQERRSRQ